MLKNDNNIDLQSKANQLRLDVVQMVHRAKDGHPGPALSIADIIAVLYFKELKIDANNPQWEDRDRFILSKGHACTDYTYNQFFIHIHIPFTFFVRLF